MRAIHFIGLCAMLVLTVPTAHADEADAAAIDAGARIAIAVCASCHGPGGNSIQSKFPQLAGQHGSYTVAQLKAFKAQTRGDPDAMAYMWGMAAQLDDATINALARYYETQQSRPGRSGDAAVMARGREIYVNGVAMKAFQPCGTCHGANAEGTNDFPRLAGQHAQYILKQLNSFQVNLRDVAVMHGVAKGLKPAQMDDVAAYLQALP